MLPLILEIISNGFSIGLILSFNLSSDDANATTSPPAFIVFKTPKPPLTIKAPVVLEVESVPLPTVSAFMDEEPSFVTSCKVLLTPAEPLTRPVPPNKVSSDIEPPKVTDVPLIVIVLFEPNA